MQAEASHTHIIAGGENHDETWSAHLYVANGFLRTRIQSISKRSHKPCTIAKRNRPLDYLMLWTGKSHRTKLILNNIIATRVDFPDILSIRGQQKRRTEKKAPAQPTPPRLLSVMFHCG